MLKGQIRRVGLVAGFMALTLFFVGVVQRKVTKEYVQTMQGTGEIFVEKDNTAKDKDVVEESTAKDKNTAEKDNAMEEKKVVYLTFDDGPGSLTEQYLDILKEHQIHATFFIIGQQAEQQKELIEREIREGHEIGIHTYTHESGKIYQSADAYEQDVDAVKRLLEGEFGYKPKFWRFPWGSANCYIYCFKKEIIGRLQGKGLEYVDWNVSAEDSIGYPSVESILNNIRKDCFKVREPVVLMHDSDGCKATLDSLEAVIGLFEENGYQFGTISERGTNCHFGEY